MVNWYHKRKDILDNVVCNICEKIQSPAFLACISCCNHKKLTFDEYYDSGWHLSVRCKDCGKNFGFCSHNLITNYDIVMKKPKKERKREK